MTSSTRTSYEHTKTSIDIQSDYSTITTPHSLSQAVQARRAEYTRPQSLKVKVGTWNVAACPGVEKDIGGWFVEGKGIDKALAGLHVTTVIDETGSQANIESVDAQEHRQSKKHSTIPLNDEGGAVASGSDIGLYVLGLQEVVELGSSRDYLSKVFVDPGEANKWKNALSCALPNGYSLVSEQQLSGMLLLIYASPEIAPSIGSVSSVSVGTGFLGYLGNKGGVTTRIVLGETTRLVFVNSHLASGTDQAHVDRRCWDVSQILNKTKYEPISRAGVLDDAEEVIGDEDFAFWFGDLNFRLDGLPGDDIRRLLLLHTRGEYGTNSKTGHKLDRELPPEHIAAYQTQDSDDDTSSESIAASGTTSGDTADSVSSVLPDPDDFKDPHADPTSLQATLDSLLPHDQLRSVQRRKKAFHDGWREGPITFLPTYKYDVGSMGMFDSSEKRRAPSWCDRILFRTRRDKAEYDGRSQEEELARLKDEEMKSRGMDHAGDDEDLLFDYDPDADGVEEHNHDYSEHNRVLDAPAEVITKEGYIDRIYLDSYTSHQRVLSSDHKPLGAVFTLQYDAIVPELKSRIQQEVARELDRAENEGRPGITVVVDHSLEFEESSLIVHNRAAPSLRRNEICNDVEGVNFGNVAFLQRTHRGLTIANTSQVEAKFSFVDKSAKGNDSSVIPTWLAMSSNASCMHDGEHPIDMLKELVLQPGESVNVALEVFVETTTLATGLNEGTAQLEDVLILRVADGRDHFIPVRASWLQSCLNRSIGELIHIPEGGVRALTPDRKSGRLVNRGEYVSWSAPREIFKLIEAIEGLTERALADKDMIVDSVKTVESPGWPFDVDSWLVRDARTRETRKASILNALDSDRILYEALPAELPANEKLEIVAEVLQLFLSSLTDGVVTAELTATLDAEFQSKIKESVPLDEQRAWVLDVLSTAPNHNVSFVFLTTMLAKLTRDTTPVSTIQEQQIVPARASLFPRRALSFRGKNAWTAMNPATVRRMTVQQRYAEIFTPVLFRWPNTDGYKKNMEERMRKIVLLFLQSSGT